MATTMKALIDAEGGRTRRGLLGLLAAGSLVVVLPMRARAQDSGGESGGGHGGGGESGGGHGGGESGGGESGGRHGAGKSPEQRAVQHRQRTGRTLGGGESTGGHTGGSGHGGGSDHTGGSGDAGNTGHTGGVQQIIPDGSTTGPIGGAAGGEHFVHEGQGSWGADTKVLRRP